MYSIVCGIEKMDAHKNSTKIQILPLLSNKNGIFFYLIFLCVKYLVFLWSTTFCKWLYWDVANRIHSGVKLLLVGGVVAKV